MSIERFRGMYTPTCDICGDELPYEDTFQLAVTARRRAGWKSQKTKDGEWEDICRKCQNGGEGADDE